MGMSAAAITDAPGQGVGHRTSEEGGEGLPPASQNHCLKETEEPGIGVLEV